MDHCSNTFSLVDRYRYIFRSINKIARSAQALANKITNRGGSESDSTVLRRLQKVGKTLNLMTDFVPQEKYDIPDHEAVSRQNTQSFDVSEFKSQENYDRSTNGNSFEYAHSLEDEM
eukprot:11161240-Ditylum_brightwellii.AAC.1